MKKIVMSLVLAFCALSLAAQDVIKVKYQGAKPGIRDFVSAFVAPVASEDDEDCGMDGLRSALAEAWNCLKAGKKMPQGTTMVLDDKNGYACYENLREGYTIRAEMCYWNESDQKHKLFAYNIVCFENGKYSPGQFDGLTFYRYDNARKQMTFVSNMDMGYEFSFGNDKGEYVSYTLPRNGKDITATTWGKKGKTTRTVKWNGRKFAKQ